MLSCMYNEYKNPGVSEEELDCLRKKGMKNRRSNKNEIRCKINEFKQNRRLSGQDWSGDPCSGSE